jgi:hypothetical protein
MDAIQISIITKEGLDIQAAGTIVPGKGWFCDINVFDLCNADECSETKFTGSDINVEDENDPKLKILDEIIHKRMKEDMTYFEQELTKLGLTLATSEFHPCEGCEDTEDCPDSWEDDEPINPKKLD